MHKTDNREETETHKCPDCDKIGIRDGDEMVCPDCGMVVGDAALSLEGRIGRPHQLGSVIDGAGPEDWQSVDDIKRYKKLKGIQEKVVKDPKEVKIEDLEKKLEGYMGFIKELDPEIYRIAKLRYTEVINPRGRPIKTTFAACLYQAYLSQGQHWTLKKISNALDVPKKGIIAAHRYLSKELKWKKEVYTDCVYDAAKAGIYRIINTMGLQGSGIREKALEFLEQDKGKIPENAKLPDGISAAYIYAAGEVIGIYGLTQLKIGEAAGVSEVTIRGRYRAFAERHVKEALNPFVR